MTTTPARVLLCVCLVFFVAACGPGPQFRKPPGETSKADVTTVDSEGRVCRTVRATGSRLGKKKVCMTEEEAERLERASQEKLEEVQRAGGTPNPT